MTTSLVHLLQHRAATTPNDIAYTYLAGDDDVRHWSWSQLHDASAAVASALQRICKPGDRVLLLYPEGLDYLAGLFGSMYAQCLAVPTHPPDPRRLERTAPRVVSVAEDAGVVVVLTTSDVLPAQSALAHSDVLAQAHWIATDTLPVAAVPWEQPQITPDQLAYLQYTSGSTSAPKGVMISHHNLLHQLADFDQGYDHNSDTVIVSWLPATHDLGLVYGRMMALFTGSRCVFLSPGAFMQRPARWLQAITRYRGTHSPSPNFGFEVAARKTTDEELATLDLSSLKVLLNGAEAIRFESEQAFRERFTSAGLPAAALTHAMGMSEATAKIMTEPIQRTEARFIWLDPVAYESAEVQVVAPHTPGAQQVASNGRTHGDTRALIVDPTTFEELPHGRVGELWITGQTVAQGYWNNPEATQTTFGAMTTSGVGPCLRTGDLAFILDSEIYLSGRLKDLIIVRGQNHHPQDIEWSTTGVHSALRPNCAIAVRWQAKDGSEGLALVAEVYPQRVSDPVELFGALREAVAHHGLAPSLLALLPPGALPKTSSGKLQRTKTLQLLLSGELQILHRWERQSTTAPQPTDLKNRLASLPFDRQQRTLLAELQSLTAGILGLDPEDCEPDRPVRELGLDSITAVELVETVAHALSLPLTATLLFQYPTLESLGDYVMRLLHPAELTPPQKARAPTAREQTASLEQAVSSLSEEEAMAALLAELDDL